jgi:hypothetical protein
MAVIAAPQQKEACQGAGFTVTLQNVKEKLRLEAASTLGGRNLATSLQQPLVTGRETERAAAETLSEALGGLPLAHEQAAAYCERLTIMLAEYHKRFEAAPGRLLDTCPQRIS